MPLMSHYKGPAIRVTQRSRSFCYIPMPSKQMAEVLGYKQLRWDEDESAFAGFNRDIDESHVIEILQGLKQENVIMPNAVIAYLLPDYFRFTAAPGSSSPIESGQAEILVDDEADEKTVGFIIDGQHRVEALRRRELEEGEDDLPTGLIVFHAPPEPDEKDLFEKFVLEQMAIINSSKPLSENEQLLVQQRLDKVFAAAGHLITNTANLIVKALDARPDSVVKFKAQNKKPANGKSWLPLSVWVRLFASALGNQQLLEKIFAGDFSESPERRQKALKVLDIYLKAVAHLFDDKSLWEASPQKQRLYHNVGIHALLALMDTVNDKTLVFSRIDPGKLKAHSEADAVKRFKKALKPIRLLDWSVGQANPEANPESAAYFESLRMAGIQQQKRIPENLSSALGALLRTSWEREEEGGQSDYLFEVRDSTGLVVARQQIILSATKLAEMDNQIDAGLL